MGTAPSRTSSSQVILFETILYFFLVLGFLVLVHELGHFATAKAFGIKVLEFGFGYPPRLFGIRRGETLYSFNLLPLGGFVKLHGEEDNTDPRSLASKKISTRLIVLSAGSLMNLLLPVFIFAVLFAVPHETVKTNVRIMEIAQNSPAYFAGILPGDRIVSIDGRGIGNSNDVNFILQTNLGSDVPWVLERNGQSIVLNLVPRYQPPPGQGASGVTLANEIVSISNVTFSSSADQIGFKVGDTLLSWGDMPVNAENHISLISELLSEREEGIINVRVWRENKIVSLAVPSSLNISTSGFEFSTKPMETQSYSLWEAIYKSVIHTKDILVLAKNEVTTWLIGARSPQLTGPIGIAQLTGEVARSGVSSLVEFTALLSINLAILNILPIPALDGGRIFFVVLEWLRGGKRIAPEREGFVHLIGFVVLLTMIAIISYRDIARIIQGEGIL